MDPTAPNEGILLIHVSTPIPDSDAGTEDDSDAGGDRSWGFRAPVSHGTVEDSGSPVLHFSSAEDQTSGSRAGLAIEIHAGVTW